MKQKKRSNAVWRYITLVVTCFTSLTAAADWKQWRGPSGQGHSTANLPTQWSETKNIAWRTSLPGKGWSSPVIEGSHIWITAAHEELASEEGRAERLKSNSGTQPVVVLSLLRLHALCIDERSGKLIYDIEILRKKDPQWAHKLNSYASPTPVISKGKLFCHFGTYGTACVDTSSATVVWRNQELNVHHENGPGSTPIIWNDKLIFHMDGSDDQFIVALNTSNGKVAWKTQRSGMMHTNPQIRKSYGTPLILETDRGTTLFSPAADWLYGYNPETGEELWKLNYGFTGFSIVPRPVAGHGLLYMSTSFNKPQLLAVRYNGSQPEIAWSYKRSVPSQPSPILVESEIYIVSDSGGMVSCLDAKSGRPHWQERIGGNFSASPLHANGKIYFHSREGVTTVLKAGTTFEILSKNKLDGALMASAAVNRDALILRTDKAIYKIENNLVSEISTPN